MDTNTMPDDANRTALIAAARAARETAYAPYSHFTVGAALLFGDGSVVTGCNVENASYGLSLCAETVASATATAAGGHAGQRGGLVAVAVAGGPEGVDGEPITPCGRCRQVLYEQAALGGTDPLVLSAGGDGVVVEERLSFLLPRAFGPAYLG